MTRLKLLFEDGDLCAKVKKSLCEMKVRELCGVQCVSFNGGSMWLL